MSFRLTALTLGFLAVFAALTFAPQAALSRENAPQVLVAYGHVAMFDTEASAQRHCPSDQVVWLNTKTGIYHEKGMRWYGRTKEGAYVCRKEANIAGYRDTRNGQ